MDIVFIEGLHVDTVIGVYDWEKQQKQPLLFDIAMETCIQQAAATDDLRHTLDYEAIANRIIAHCQAVQVELLETLVEQLARLILTDYPVQGVRIKVHKPEAVQAARSVGIEIYRRATAS